MWKFSNKISGRRSAILHGLLAITILGVLVFDAWLMSCGFDGCPSPREIQQ